MSKHDKLIPELLNDPNYMLCSDWKIYTNRPPAGKIGKKYIHGDQLIELLKQDMKL